MTIDVAETVNDHEYSALMFAQAVARERRTALAHYRAKAALADAREALAKHAAQPTAKAVKPRWQAEAEAGRS